MKIVVIQIFAGEPPPSPGEPGWAPEWEARVEGFQDDLAPFGSGSTPERAVADLKECFCPCDCAGEPEVEWCRDPSKDEAVAFVKIHRERAAA